METFIIAVFVTGYLGIAFEHVIKVNKTATAILTGVICWTLFILATPAETLQTSSAYLSFLEILKLDIGADGLMAMGDHELYRAFVITELELHLGAIAQILFFLMGAMTIVELVDAHHGFRFITSRIKTRNPLLLLWIVCWVTFFLSAILDNLTTSIVMVSMIRKLVADKDQRLFFAGMIVIAANAGGAWTPIGDVTTTMLWIGGQITTLAIIKSLLLPSVVCMLVPLIYLTITLKPALINIPENQTELHTDPVGNERLMLFLGLSALISVPIFKTLVHLPPFTGMLLGLSILWIITELIHPELDEAFKKNFTVAGALSRIDVPSVLFFLGILLAVGALESTQILHHLAQLLDDSFQDERVIVTLIGLLSALVDNVPLVAASMGMYHMDLYPQDHMLWQYLAYCAGTGGSILIIGSAAGVAVMGMENVNFIWYLRKLSLLALMGFLSGAAVYLLIQ